MTPILTPQKKGILQIAATTFSGLKFRDSILFNSSGKTKSVHQTSNLFTQLMSFFFFFPRAMKPSGCSELNSTESDCQTVWSVAPSFFLCLVKQCLIARYLPKQE